MSLSTNRLRIVARNGATDLLKDALSKTMECDPSITQSSQDGLSLLFVDVTNQQWNKLKENASSWLALSMDQSWFVANKKEPTDLVVVSGKRNGSSATAFSTLVGANLNAVHEPDSATFIADLSSSKAQVISKFVEGKPFDESNARYVLEKSGIRPAFLSFDAAAQKSSLDIEQPSLKGPSM